MASFRFVGRSSQIGWASGGEKGQILDEFGQVVELPDEVADELVRGGCALLPAEDFDALGFTNEELGLYKYPGPQTGAPPEFQVKLQAARGAFRELRATGLKPVIDEDAAELST